MSVSSSGTKRTQEQQAPVDPFEVLVSLGQRLGACLEPSACAVPLAEAAAELGWDECLLLWREPQSETFVPLGVPAEAAAGALPWSAAVVPLLQELLLSQSEVAIPTVEHTALLPRGSACRVHARALLAVPLLVREEVLGALLLGRAEPVSAFSPRDLAAGRGLAQQVALALDNDRLRRENVQRVSDLAKLLQVIRRPTALLDLDATLEYVLERMLEATGALAANVSLIGPDGKIQTRAGVGFRSSLGELTVRPDGISVQTMAAGKPAIFADVHQHLDAVNPDLLAAGVRASVCLPLQGWKQTVGVMWVHYARPHAFGPEEMELLSTFSSHAAIAIENARLYHESVRIGAELRRSFNRVGEALAASLDLDRSLQLIADQAVSLTDAQAATIQLAAGESKDLVLRASSGPSHAALVRLQAERDHWLTAAILHSRSSVQVADLAEDPRTADLAYLAEANISSFLGVPLALRGKTIGVLSLARSTAGTFSAAEVELLSSFASQAAIALESAQLFSALQNRLRELSGLYEISLTFGSLERLDDTYLQLGEHIAKLLDVDRCAILLYDEESRALVAQAPAYGLTPEQVGILRIPMEEGSAAHRCWRTGQPYLTNNAPDDENSLHRYARLLGDRSMLIVPMRVGDRVVGLLRASNKRGGRFTNNDLRLLTILATQAGVVLQNARLYNEVAREREQFKAIFDNASDGIMMVGRDGTVVGLNRAMEDLSGWSAGEAVGQSCQVVQQCHDEKGTALCDLACPIVKSLQGRTSTPYQETIIRTRDGKDKDVAISYSFIPSAAGKPEYCIAIVRDISKAKEVERLKTQFISTVSHELRTPLASVKACIGVLLASVPPETPDPILRLMRNIDRSSERMENLVSDLLDLNRLQSGRVHLNLQPVDLADVARAAAATVRPLAEAKEQELALELAAGIPAVMADRGRLEQVALNLLSNAHKYSPRGGRIALRVDAIPRRVVVSVRDQGAGVPPEEQEYIFERFYRRETAETQRNTGSGLGLPIARALVELHGGRIWMESIPGQGSTFSFSIPVERDEALGRDGPPAEDEAETDAPGGEDGA